MYVLRGLLICGLVVTFGTGEAALYGSLRTALPVLAGLVFGTALAEAEAAGRAVSFRWALPLLATWLATLSPVMWGDREMLRTCAVSGVLALLIRRQPMARPQAWATAAILAVLMALAPSGPPWAQRAMAELQYGLGVAWPRGSADVVRDIVLFLLGCWTAGGPALHALGRWRGIADPFRALGRMPLTAAAAQYGAVTALIQLGAPGAHPTWVRPLMVGALLIAQLAFSTWWLQARERGPCEHALHVTQTMCTAMVGKLRARLNPPTAAAPSR